VTLISSFSEHGNGFGLLSLRRPRWRLYVFISTVIVALSAFLPLARSSALWGYPLHHRGQTKIHLALIDSRDDRPAVFANPRIHSYVLVGLSQLISKVKDRSRPLSVPEVQTVFMHHVD
jgi:hypothetical protein